MIVIYLWRIINCIYDEILLLGFYQFVSQRLTNNLKEYLKQNYGNNLNDKKKLLEFILEIIFGDSIDFPRPYPSKISSYDVIIMICYDDDLYILFEDYIPHFHYIDFNIFDHCINKSFGRIYQNQFSIYLKNFLKSKVSYLQHCRFSDVRDYVHKVTGVNYVAPLNVYGEYLTFICNNIKNHFNKKFDINDKSCFNFLNLATIINELNYSIPIKLRIESITES